ncbi:MAG: PAS domain S-box protein [Phycisphaeraceae bacterium]
MRTVRDRLPSLPGVAVEASDEPAAALDRLRGGGVSGVDVVVLGAGVPDASAWIEQARQRDPSLPVVWLGKAGEAEAGRAERVTVVVEDEVDAVVEAVLRGLLVRLAGTAGGGPAASSSATSAAPRVPVEQPWLAALFNNANDPILVYPLSEQGEPGRLLEVNDAAVRMTGYSRDELRRMRPADLVDASVDLPHVLEQLLSERSVLTPSVHVAKDGRRIPVEVHAQRFELNGQSLVISVVRNVSERERAMRQQRMLIEASQVLGESIDYGTTLANVARVVVPAHADWYVIDLAEPGGTLEPVVVMHADPAKVKLAQRLRQRYPAKVGARSGAPNVIRTGQSELYADVSDELLQEVAEDETHLATLRGLGLRSALVVPLVARGRTLGAMTLVSETPYRYTERDVPMLEELARRCGLAVDNARLYRDAQRELAERKQAEQALRHSEVWLRQAIEGMAVGVYATDAQGRILHYNREATALWGRSPEMTETYERFSGSLRMYKPDGTFLPHEDCPTAEVLDKQEAVEPSEVVMERPDGSRVMVLMAPSPIHDDQGRMIGAINCMIDVTARRAAEHALHEREAQFRAIVDQAAVGIAQADLAGRFQLVNDRFCQITGYSQHELRQKNILQITHSEDVGDNADFLKKLLQGAVPSTSQEKRYIRKDGQPTWVRVNASLVRDSEGQPKSILGIIEDINQRKLAEAALRQSEERLRLIIESATDYAIFTIGLDGNVTSWNRGAERLLGYEESEIIGQSTHRVFTRQDRENNIPEQEMDTAERNDSAMDERWHRRKDGSLFWASGRMTAMRDDAGRVQGYLKILRDQTEVKQAHEQLESRARQQQAVARLGQQALAQTDVQALMDEAVQVVADTLGNDLSKVLELQPDGKTLLFKAGVGWRAGVVGKTTINATRDAQAGYTLEANQPVIVQDLAEDTRFTGTAMLHAHGAVSGMSVVITGSGGQPYGVLSTFSRVHRSFTSDDINFLQAVANILAAAIHRKATEDRLRQLTDTLEQRVVQRTSQLRALAAELTQTEQRERRRLAQVLHDHLQQLLVASKLQVSLARRRAKDEDLRQLLQEASDLVDQSVAASRSLTVELSPPILYEGGLRAGLEWLARWMEQKHNLHVVVHATEDVEPAAEDVRVFLFQAVRELLFNIVKHAGVDQADVRLQRVSGNRLEIQVADQGQGFDPEAVTRPDTTGGGLGLFSIHERLEVVGGRMSVDSQPGRGTRMTLQVPLTALPEAIPAVPEASQAQAARRAATAPRPEPRERSEVTRVLVADDHKIMREGLVRLLNAHPAITVVGEAADGNEAVQRAQQLYPDVVIMDVTMPGLNGIDATRQLTAALPDVRVIGLSVHEQADMAAAMYQAGAEGYLSKGGPSEHLIAAIQNGPTEPPPA